MPRAPKPVPRIESIPDVRSKWAERLPRVLASQERTKPEGMTRPARSKAKRVVLARSGQLGPFSEASMRASTSARKGASGRSTRSGASSRGGK